METFASIVVGILVAWLLVLPYFRHGDAGNSVLARNDLVEERERLLRVLRDLELDLKTRKINESDFLPMKTSLSLDLSKVLRALGEI